MAFRDSCASELNNTTTPPPHTCIKTTYQHVKGVLSPIYWTASLLFCAIVAVVEVEDDRQPCRKSIYASFGNVRLRMKGHCPKHIYKEDVLRRSWLLHIILVVVWGWNVVVGMSQFEMGGFKKSLPRDHHRLH